MMKGRVKEAFEESRGPQKAVAGGGGAEPNVSFGFTGVLDFAIARYSKKKCFLEYNVQKPSNPSCYAPSLEPFRISQNNQGHLITQN
jgi:hypothetical protein